MNVTWQTRGKLFVEFLMNALIDRKLAGTNFI